MYLNPICVVALHRRPFFQYRVSRAKLGSGHLAQCWRRKPRVDILVAQEERQIRPYID